MYILGIETSCDETSAAVVERKNDKVRLLSNVVSSSLAIHKKTGGIIPENAAREQVKFILPVIKEALNKAFDTSDTFPSFDILKKVDALAVTYGPGLIGSLLVGVETAKTISYVFNKPIIPVNHMIGHIYANWLIADGKEQIEKQKPYAISNKPYAEIHFPAIALVVSGGHTDLLLMKDHGDLLLLGGTRDDAAGEAFDKIGRLLGLSYPAGPEIEQRAKKADQKRFRFPRPLIGSSDFDFSFSGLKTAVLREVQDIKDLNEQTINDLAFATQESIIDVLTRKTLKAASVYDAKSILISGGVAANQKLKDKFEQMTSDQRPMTKFFAPAKNLCTDNAAMIGAAACFNNAPVVWDQISANPELYF
jgi:N6-L-threonylcarbamoyladenine synthase